MGQPGDGSMLSFEDGGKSWQEDGYVSTAGWRRVVDPFPLMRRMSRGGIFGIWPQSDGARICVGPKMILRAEAGSSEYRCVFSFPRGSRPLNLCEGKDGRIYWGEYFLNLPLYLPPCVSLGQQMEARNGRSYTPFRKVPYAMCTGLSMTRMKMPF